MTSTPDPLDDDAIAEALADEVTERILRDYPKASGEFRLKLVPLYMARATGELGEAEPATRQRIGEAFGVSSQRALEIEAVGLARIFRRHGPVLREFLQS